VVERSQILETLYTVFGEQRLRQVFVKGKKAGEKVAREAIQKGLDQGFRVLAELGFITLLGSDRIRLRQPLTRFMEPHKGTDQAQAIQQLLAEGELNTDTGERSFELFEEDEV
jgi:chromosome condensin MukBEF MukE localization factor